MNGKLSWYNVLVGLLCLGGFTALFLKIDSGLVNSELAIRLPALLITGVMALFATLALVAVTFSVSGLSDPTQALGLPEGSIRAMIALALIVIFAITAIFFYDSLANRVDPGTPMPADDFAKTAFTVVGTLMTSVVSFYFASRGAATSAEARKSTPELTSVVPATIAAPAAGAAPTVATLAIAGSDLQLAKTVKLAMAGAAVLGTDISSREDLVKCSVSVDATTAKGAYDVIVTNSDGAAATLPAAFTVT
ncbi:MAG: hypothetical protein LAO77_22095 [Acidobacteriia bacterium]|nr:hypothetical protein [Terriglobia bacterium]